MINSEANCSKYSSCSQPDCSEEKDGEIRPVAVDNVMRKLMSKKGINRIVPIISQELPPDKGGCEAAAHAICEFVEHGTLNKINDSILVILDMTIAFSTVCRDNILEICECRAHSLHRLVSLAYSSVNNLVLRDNLVQQCDSLGPVLFALADDDIALLSNRR